MEMNIASRLIEAHKALLGLREAVAPDYHREMDTYGGLRDALDLNGQISRIDRVLRAIHDAGIEGRETPHDPLAWLGTEPTTDALTRSLAGHVTYQTAMLIAQYRAGRV